MIEIKHEISTYLPSFSNLTDKKIQKIKKYCVFLKFIRWKHRYQWCRVVYLVSCWQIFFLDYSWIVHNGGRSTLRRGKVEAIKCTDDAIVYDSLIVSPHTNLYYQTVLYSELSMKSCTKKQNRYPRNEFFWIKLLIRQKNRLKTLAGTVTVSWL